MLLDVLEHLTEPQRLLAALSDWSLKHGNPLLVVSVPNVAHFDLGFACWSGSGSPAKRVCWTAPISASLPRRHWDGWPSGADGVSWPATTTFSLRSDQYDEELNEELPVEMVGALRAMADSYNPQAPVQQFVWALRPFR